jgi:HSP20 family protein
VAITQYTLRNARPSARRSIEEASNRLSPFFEETPADRSGFVPPVNIAEGKNELSLTIELPGVNESDLSIDLENSVLTISGEKVEIRTEGEEEIRHHVRERRYGAFKRRFQLPRSVQTEGIGAHFENGLLTVTLPKSEEAQGRKIEIAKN